MRQRFMTIAVDQQRTAGWRGVHTHNFVRRRCSVGNDITLFRAKVRAMYSSASVCGPVWSSNEPSSVTEIETSALRVFPPKNHKTDSQPGFLICGAAHMPRRTKGVLPLFDVGKQGFRERRCNVIKIFVGVLTHTNGDIFRLPQRIFKTRAPSAYPAR